MLYVDILDTETLWLSKGKPIVKNINEVEKEDTRDEYPTDLNENEIK